MITKNQVLFIHGGGEGAYEEDSKLARSLQEVLGTSYDVRWPEMPNEENPEYETWKKRIVRELAALEGKIILVGHSVGALLLLKYLSEENITKPIAGMYLIAPPYFGAGGWEVDEDVLKNDFASRLPQDLPVFFYHSRDDEVVPFEHLALYAEQLPQAAIHEFDGRGHQFDNDLSEVARDIKKL